MSYIIKVRVQLPDGSIDFLPLCGDQNNEYKMLEFESKEECRLYAQDTMPRRVIPARKL